MIRFAIILSGILFSSFFVSCTNKINGVWYSCTKDGYYIELLVENNELRFFTGNYISEKIAFKIVDDTLIYKGLNAVDSIIESKAVIRINRKKHLQLDYQTVEEQWDFYRTEGKINDFDNGTQLLKAGKTREKMHFCKDGRTIEDKQQDSLNFIYFQF